MTVFNATKVVVVVVGWFVGWLVGWLVGGWVSWLVKSTNQRCCNWSNAW